VYQNILFLPTFFSVLLVARFLALLFNNERGLVNVLWENLGLSPIPFYDISAPWIAIIVFTYIWKGVGYSLIVYLAVITGFDKEMYEAAGIDGAGRIRQIFSITLPMLVPTVIILLLLAIGKIFFGDFQLIYAVAGTTNEALLKRLDIVETYLFRMVTGSTPDYGLAGAVGLFQTALGFVLIFGSNFLIKLYNKDYALF
jgi:putative aldouronate transport system permease protein